MLKNYSITLKNKGIGYIDNYGGYISGEETSKEIDVDMQPYSRELLLRKYGYDIQVSKLMICDLDNDIKEGSIVVYKDKNYIVKKIPCDEKHMEVVLDGL